MEKGKKNKGMRRAVAPIVALVLITLALYALGVTNAPQRGTDNAYTADGMVFTGELCDGSFYGIGKIVFGICISHISGRILTDFMILDSCRNLTMPGLTIWLRWKKPQQSRTGQWIVPNHRKRIRFA